MYELLFSAPHGSTIDYKEENEKIIPVLNDNVIFNQVIKEFQETALELCKVAIKYNDYMDIINPVVATEQYRKFLEENILYVLEDLQLTIGEVSIKVGYTDQLTFSKIFKKTKGVSPKLYRQLLLD